jgi:hypothetical protein
MSDAFLYLTTRGRVTGQPRRIEIWFVEHAGKYYILAEGREQAASVVPVTPATARFVDRAASPELAAAVAKAMDAKYNWSDGLIVEIAPVGAVGG